MTEYGDDTDKTDSWEVASHKTSRLLDQGNSTRQMSYPKSGMEKFLRVDGEFLSPTVGMP